MTAEDVQLPAMAVSSDSPAKGPETARPGSCAVGGTTSGPGGFMRKWDRDAGGDDDRTRGLIGLIRGAMGVLDP